VAEEESRYSKDALNNMINLVGSSRYKLDKKRLKTFVKALFEKTGIAQQATLNIVFVGKRKMKDIANTYKHENVALPVLAFPYNQTTDSELLIGEIFICYPQAVLLAAERSKRVDDMMEQLVEHGINNIVSNS
jgi:rRNA maturation RNase YbeY